MTSVNRMRAGVWLLIVGANVVGAGACGEDPSDSDASSITVFAAASLTGAFTEIGEAFSATNPDVDVVFSFAASSELVAQIDEGAPADVFASADLENMTKLTEADGVAGPPEVFATNVSAIIVAAGNPLGIEAIADLGEPDLVVVICASEVPCGRYAAEIFANAGVAVTPDSFEQNVKAVVTKVTLGEADAGIAYATDVIAAGGEADGVEIPADINVVADYPIAVPNGGPNPDGGQAFVEFVLSEAGQSILASYGFSAP
jgi:molybdate transport system substrate-binding protein